MRPNEATNTRAVRASMARALGLSPTTTLCRRRPSRAATILTSPGPTSLPWRSRRSVATKTWPRAVSATRPTAPPFRATERTRAPVWTLDVEHAEARVGGRVAIVQAIDTPGRLVHCQRPGHRAGRNGTQDAPTSSIQGRHLTVVWRGIAIGEYEHAATAGRDRRRGGVLGDEGSADEMPACQA